MYQNDYAGPFSSLLNPCMPNVQNGERIVDPDKKSHAAIYIKRFGRLLAIIKGYSWSMTWKVFFGARRVIHFLTSDLYIRENANVHN